MARVDAEADGAGRMRPLDLAAAGETALRRLAVQVGLLYLVGPVLMTLLLATPSRWIWGLVFVSVVVVCAVTLVRGVGALCSPATRRRLVALSMTAGFLMPWVNLASAPEPVLAGQAWVLTAVPGALAVASGAMAAGTAFLVTAGASWLGVTLAGGSVRLLDFGAPLVSLSVCVIWGAGNKRVTSRHIRSHARWASWGLVQPGVGRNDDRP
jgi:hypothetical protein